MEIEKKDFDAFREEMRSFKDSVAAGFRGMNDELKALRAEVTEKLTGIASFLLNSERGNMQLDERVTSLEERVDRLENKGPAA